MSGFSNNPAGSGGAAGSVSITGSLPAGTNNLGTVQVADGTTPTQKQAVSAGGAASVTVATALPAGTALIGNVGVAQASTTSGQAGVLVQGAVTTAMPTYVTAQTAPLSLTVGGLLRTSLFSSGGTAAGFTSGGALTIGGSYSLSAPTIASGGNGGAQIDPRSNLYVNTEARIPTYRASGSVVVAATPTDVFLINGSATTSVRLRRLEISGFSTAGGGILAQLIKRSAANSGGTSTAMTDVSHDTADSAGTAIMLGYTANPTPGATVGAIASFGLPLPTVALAVPPIVFEFGGRNADKALVLTGVAQGLALNLGGGAIPAGTSIQFTAEFTEY